MNNSKKSKLALHKKPVGSPVQTITSMFKRQTDASTEMLSHSKNSKGLSNDDVILIEDDDTESPYFKKGVAFKKRCSSSSLHRNGPSPKKLLLSLEHSDKSQSTLTEEKQEDSSYSFSVDDKSSSAIAKKWDNSCKTQKLSLKSDQNAKSLSSAMTKTKSHRNSIDTSVEKISEESIDSSSKDLVFEDQYSDVLKVDATGPESLSTDQYMNAEVGQMTTGLVNEMGNSKDAEVQCKNNDSGSSMVKMTLKQFNKAVNSEREENSSETKEADQRRAPYYLRNFETILHTVMEDKMNTDLFNAEDLQTISTFQNLSEAAKRLYVRLFSRKFSWIPLSKLNYPEISEDLQPILKDLCTSLLIENDDHLTDLCEVLKALSAGDIKMMAKSYHLSPTVTQKKQIMQELMKKTQQANLSSMFGSCKHSLADAMLKKAKIFLKADSLHRLKAEHRTVFVRVMMLFSLLDTSGDDDSSAGGQGQLFHLLMVNMGKLVYPTYQVQKVHSVFKSREDLIRFEQALQLESELLHCTEKGRWEEAHTVYLEILNLRDLLERNKEIRKWDENLPDFLRPFTATSVLYRLLNVGIEILQRRKDMEGAIALLHKLLSQDLYCCSYRGYWWERLALNLDAHMKKPLEALEAISKGLADRNVKVGHRYALYLRAEAICQRPKFKLKKRLSEFFHEPVREIPKVFLDGRVVHQGVMTSGTRFILEKEDDDMTVVGVEEFVLDHYNNHGYPSGIHAEGSIISCLFALFFWDILLMDVPDAFQGPFQSQPLDLYTDSFYENRKEAIDQRLEELRESSMEQLQQTVLEVWTQHEGVVLAGMNWEKMRSAEFINGLVQCMGSEVVSGILGRVARCPRHTRSGFPDLTLWNVDSGKFKICEVKGPNDRLSNKQILWINFLLSIGVDAEVCHVKAVAAKKLKK